jgi:hypothetical protein
MPDAEFGPLGHSAHSDPWLRDIGHEDILNAIQGRIAGHFYLHAIVQSILLIIQGWSNF